ncbi:uncharacterized protein ACMZJ9_021776 [Mantella aurantiaca]
MAALSLHSHPFQEAAILSMNSFPSQRLIRHALAILHLLTVEGDTVTSEDDLSGSHDRKIHEKKLLVDQIMKLVLGILNLLNEGPQPSDHIDHFSEEEWLRLEKEQRQLYSQLVSDNQQTLQALGTCSVKTESIPSAEIEEVTVSPADEVSCDIPPSGKLYSDPPRSPLSDSYHNPFLDVLKGSSLSSFSASANHTDSNAGSFICDATLHTYPRTFPEPCKDSCMNTLTEEPGISRNVQGSSFTDTYVASSSDDFQENMAILKQERSDLHLPACSVDLDCDNRKHRQQISFKKQGPSSMTTFKKQGPSPMTTFKKQGPSPMTTFKKQGPSPMTTFKKQGPSPVTSDRTRSSTQSQEARTFLEYNPNPLSVKKPFQCQRCEKSFNCSSHLIAHQYVHTRERPYVCECGKSFTQSSNLFRHQRAHRGERPHVCTVCGKAFAQSSHLIIHKRTHTGERPYLCGDCGKSFLANSALVRHQRVHMGEKRCTTSGLVKSNHLHPYQNLSIEQNLQQTLQSQQVLSRTSQSILR